MWGEEDADDKVFSAHAEVVPSGSAGRQTWNCILRARGGSSVSLWALARFDVYSPRTRR